MTIEEQIAEEQEEVLAQASFDNEENELFKATLAAIILLAAKYNLENTIQRRKFIEKVKEEFTKLTSNIYSLYKSEYGLKVGEEVLGYTIKDMVNSLTSKKYVDIKKFVNSNKAITTQDLDKFFKDDYKKQAIKETLSKYIYEKKLEKQKSNYGWVSVSVMDTRTSSICVSLNGKFYSAKDYPTRGDIPNIPPRHFRCRSILVQVGNKEELDSI